MTARRAPWPGEPPEDGTGKAVPPGGPDPGTGADARAWRARLADAVAAADAPDAVFAVSRQGHRTLHAGGTGPGTGVPREDLRYEIGSATKTFTGLLLAHLTASGVLTGGEPAVTCLAPDRPAGPRPVTLAHLITHTSGLPALPRDFRRRALPAWRTNPYGRYPADRVVAAFLRHHPGTGPVPAGTTPTSVPPCSATRSPR